MKFIVLKIINVEERDMLAYTMLDILTHCMLGNLSFFSSYLQTFFFKKLLLKHSFKNTIEVSNSLDPDQDRHFLLILIWVQTYWKADDKSCHQQGKS